MKFGFDFDNTIVRYDRLFHRVALEKHLIPAHLPVDKNAVRDHLRAEGKEDLWTELQGYVYGARMQEAEPFPGMKETLSRLRDDGHALFIISHKTRLPYKGPAYDLHQAARNWITSFLIDTSGKPLFADDCVFFHERKEEKIRRIAELGCDVFLDDLPEILLHESFPAQTRRYLLSAKPMEGLAAVEDWGDFYAAVTSEAA